MTDVAAPPRAHRARWRAGALAATLAISGCGLFGGSQPAGEGPDTQPAVTIAARAAASPEHELILAAYGGAYDDPDARAAVAMALDPLLDSGGPAPALTILDSPAVNAFALPGGGIYVTRGLIALTSDPAELAAVLAHELAHLAARHAVARQAELDELALVDRLALVLGETGGARAAAEGARLSVAAFSQAQELEADALGIAALAAAGFDPHAGVRFLTSMGRFSTYLDGGTAEGEDGDGVDFLSSHPAPPQRIAAAAAVAYELAPVGPAPAGPEATAYLALLDGLAYGDDPGDGLVRGRTYLNPAAGFAFTVPEGFVLDDTEEAVLASGPGGVAMRFDHADIAPGGDLVGYLTSGWINGLVPASVRTGSAGLVPAAFAEAEAGGFVYHVAVLRPGAEAFRMLFAARAASPAFDAAFTATAASLRLLDIDERQAVKPLRLAIVTVAAGDSAESLAATMAPGLDRPVALFRALNGLDAGAQPVPGQMVKLVVE